MTVAQLPFGITVCGLDELAGHGPLQATHVLSILDPTAPVPEAFGTYGEHARLELRFDDIVDETEGMRAPDRGDVERILGFGRDLLAEPKAAAHLIVHCHAGISRSTASMALILAQALPDQPAAEILHLVHDIREKAWPNLRLMEMGDTLLGRDGTLVAATHALHALQLARRPHLAEFMSNLGRSREVQAAQAVGGEVTKGGD